MDPRHLKWVEIDSSALRHNISEFRNLVGDRKIYSVIKANAYGHGLLEVAENIKDLTYGFAVNHVDEALKLRHAGIEKPILVLGYILPERFTEVADNNISIVVYSQETIDKLAKLDQAVNVHVKVECGTSRQGIEIKKLQDFVEYIQTTPNVSIEGIYTHYANIEDTTDHSYADMQLNMYQRALEYVGKTSDRLIKHTASTAAAILFPETYFDAVRVGIGIYGLWPSGETKVSAKDLGKKMPNLHPVLAWKTRVAQVKEVAAGTPIAYGLTYVTTRRTKIAVLPVGYSDGYDRKLSNNSYITIHGKRAPLLGRVMMNMIVIDVTDIANVQPEDEVILLGKGGMSTEEMASRIGTINYEVVTRLNWELPRVIVQNCL